MCILIALGLCKGYDDKQNIHWKVSRQAQCTTLMSPNEGETAVCGSLMNFSILGDWEAITGCQFNRTSVPQPRLDLGHLAGLALYIM